MTKKKTTEAPTPTTAEEIATQKAHFLESNRHLTSVKFILPLSGKPSKLYMFTRVEKDADGHVLHTADAGYVSIALDKVPDQILDPVELKDAFDARRKFDYDDLLKKELEIQKIKETNANKT